MKKPYNRPKLTPLDAQEELLKLEAAAQAGDADAQKMLQYAPKESAPADKVLNQIICAD